VRLHTYVIATDAGSAPNYDPPFTTLAVCKPRIRRKAALGDVVLAFTGVTVGPDPHAVCWAGQVKEKLTFAEYWRDRRFRGKKPGQCQTPDNFYEPVAGGLRQIANRTHGPGALMRDTGGLYVLVCDPTWRFGKGGPNLPSEFGFRVSLTARRGERAHDLSPTAWRSLREWFECEKMKRSGLPVDASGRSCGQLRKGRGRAKRGRRTETRC
jgi:hypothetical protein